MAWSSTATRLAVAVVAVMVVMGTPAPSRAQITGHPIELSAGAGILNPDSRAMRKNGPAFKGAVGWRFLPNLVVEGQATFAPGDADTAPNQPHNFSMGGVDLRWNLRPAEAKILPFLLAGGGYGLSHTSGTPPDKLGRGAGTFGLGLLYNAFDQRCYIRVEARDILFQDRYQDGFSHHTG